MVPHCGTKIRHSQVTNGLRCVTIETQVSNSGTNNVALDPAVDVDARGRNLVLEAINAIEVVEAREVIEHAIVRLAAQRRSEAVPERTTTPPHIACPG